MKFYLSLLSILFTACFSVAQNTSVFSLGLDNIKQRANTGDMDAMVTLGDYYFNGVMVEKDSKIALSWYEKAANKGSVDAMYNTAVCYSRLQNGNGSDEKAFEYFTKAADKGHSIAQYNLAACYINAIGTKRDMIKAYYYFSLASKDIPDAEDKVKDLAKRMPAKDLATAKTLVKKSQLNVDDKKLHSDNKDSSTSTDAKNGESMNQKDMRPDDAFEL